MVAGRRPGLRRRAGHGDEQGPAARLRRSTCKKLVDLSGIRPLKVVVDAGNGMAGHTVPIVFEGLPLTLIAAVLRARRHVPQPRGQPDRPGEPARPAAGGQGQQRRHRPGLRRRRRPLLRRRRARRDRQPVGADRADRDPRAGPRARRDGHPQPDHLTGGARADHRARRHPGPHPGRPLVHQGEDGGDQRRVRRRALGPLLLQGLLVRRLGHARRAARARRARPRQTGRCRPCSRTSPGTRRAARSTARSPTRPPPRAGQGRLLARPG